MGSMDYENHLHTNEIAADRNFENIKKLIYYSVFFFQAEDGIRDDLVTGVQTCALPISALPRKLERHAETEDADENGQGNRDGNDQRASPVSEEEQNHDGREAGGDDRFANDALDGSADVERLVEKGRDMQAFRDRAFVVLEHLLDTINDIDR